MNDKKTIEDDYFKLPTEKDINMLEHLVNNMDDSIHKNELKIKLRYLKRMNKLYKEENL